MAEKRIPKAKKNKTKITLSKGNIALIVTACILVIAVTVVSCLAASYDKIYKGISVCGANVGGLTLEDATLSLEDSLGDKAPEVKININDKAVSLSFRDFGEYDFETSANNAFNYGRNGFFARFYTYATPFIAKDLPLEFYIDEEKVAELLHAENSKLGASYADTKYEVKDDKLLITVGHSGNFINTSEIIKQAKEAIAAGNDVEIDAVIAHKEYKGVDLDAIYAEVAGNAEDAYYDKSNGKIVPHKLGYKFDKNAAKELLADAAENTTVEIALEVEYPEVTEAKLSGKMFEDVLASYTTKYNPGEVDRTHNMQLAGAKVNGTVLAAGQIFSYNDVVGQRTVAKGYRNAKIFENGRVVDGLAGGICQVSTTIYNAALYSNMGIVERKNHSFPVSYAPMGQDATVVMGAIDFKFKNTTNNPIKLTCSISGGNCTVSILGIKENNYKVEIGNVTTGSTAFGTEYQHDETMEIGKEKVIQKGSYGYTIKSTRTVYENGKVIKTESLPSSYYIPLKQIIARNESEDETVEGEENKDNPEGETEVKPEDKQETKPEVKPEVTPEAQPEVKPEVKPEPEVKQEPVTEPEVQPEPQPEVTPETQPEVQPEVQPEPEPTIPETETETEIN